MRLSCKLVAPQNRADAAACSASSWSYSVSVSASFGALLVVEGAGTG